MADRIGQRLGNYTVVKLLGQGGFAEVYLGEHMYLKSQAAIKILQTRLSSSDDTDNFLREAQTIARLSHPNIVRVMDFGIENETPYLVMDYAPNGTLRQRHPRDTALPLVTIVPYVRQVAEALQYAHDERLIHRDIKPENMLVGRRNEVLLSDFGIALVAQSSRYQGTEDVIGTVAYMSPEQIQGRPRPASDQYSLGIVVYEWLTGTRPFRGSFTELCTQHMFANPPSLSEKLPLVSPDVERVLMRALAKEPKQRFDTIVQFAQELEAASKSANTVEIRTDANNTSYETIAQTGFTTRPESLSTPLPSQQHSSQTGSSAQSLSQQQFSSQQQASNTGTGSQSLHPQHTSMVSQQQSIPNLGTSAKPTYTQQQQLQSQPQNPLPTLHSSTTEAHTRADVPQHTPTPKPGQANQFGPQKMILPSQSNQPQQSQPAWQQQPNPQAYRQEQQFHPQTPNHYANYQQHAQAQQPQQQYSPYQQQQPQHYQQQQYQPQSQQQAAHSPYQQQNMAQHTPSNQSQYRPEPQREEAPRSETATNQPTESSESIFDFLGLSGTAKWRIAATVVGIVLFCLARNFTPTIYNYTIPFLLVIAIFFGGAFGPVVGGLVALTGVFFSTTLYSDVETFRVFTGTGWFPYLFYGALGILPGLAVIFRKKLYPSIGTAIRSCILTLMGMAALLGFLLYQFKILGSFVTIGLPVLLSIGASLILLIAYGIMGKLVDPS